jgi:hypothetical protein
MPFIGREEELAKIERLIQEAGTRRVLCINGVGGIGKTSLLIEIYKRYAGNKYNSVRITRILDFDNRVLHLPENIERQIAQQLDEATFEPYLRELLDWRKMESVGVSREGLEKQNQRVREIFIDCINQFSQDHRIALLFDTTEKLEDEVVWERLISFMEASQNTIFLLAGRNAKELYTTLTNIPIGNEVQLIDLPPFTEIVGQQYLEQKESLRHITLDADLKQKLLLLSGGRPILLDLAVEWLTRELPRDWMTQKSYEELLSLPEEQLTKYKKDFEEQLVRHIIRIREPIDRLTLVMSWIYPLNPKMIAKLLNVSQERAQKLFDEAQTYVFIKSLPDSRITLHDEMRRMVEEYVWRDVYPVERRRRDSRIAAELFEQEDKRLKERLAERETGDLGRLFERAALAREPEIINQQWIEHALYSDTESGFDVWKRIIDEQRAENKFSFAKSLLEIARPYYEQFNPDQRFEFDMLIARLTSDTGQVREAEEMLKNLLVLNLGIRSREANIYNALALVEEKLGKLREARDHQLDALKIVEEINERAVPFVANRAGYIHRLLEELPEAEKYYKLALDKSNKNDLRFVADLFNNLGYIYGAQKKYRRLELYCRRAREIWSNIGAEREIGRAEATEAIFFRVRRNYDQAIKLLEGAINRYEEPDDHEKLCRAYWDLGWTQWYKGEKVDETVSDIRLLDWDDKLLEQASQSLEKSRKLAEQYGLEALLPGILHLNALVYWYLGRMAHKKDEKKGKELLNKGRELNRESYSKSKQVGDIRYAISSLLADAEWDYEIEKYEDMDSYAKELENYKREAYHYPLYFGRMLRIEADIAFTKGNLATAFSKYAEGLALIHQHGGFGRYAIERELLRLERKMVKLQNGQFKEFSEYLYQKWVNIGHQDTYLLTAWSEQLMIRYEIGVI